MAQMNMAAMIEPYRKGASFSDWVERLGYFFAMSNVAEDAKKSHFITLSGPSVFSELKLLFPNASLTDISYETMIEKLKARFDKVESDIIQRFKFNNRKQHPDESAEDFVLAIKLQAEFCNFKNFKHEAIRERIVAGLRDEALQQRLLNEQNLTLESAEKLIATWEMAGANARSLGIGVNAGQIASLNNDFKRPRPSTLEKLAKTLANAKAGDRPSRPAGTRQSVKIRLGFQPYYYNGEQEDKQKNFAGFRPAEWRAGQDRNRSESRVCDFCGIRGHLKRNCFKLKNQRRDMVQFVDSKTGPSSLSELFNRLETNASDVDDDNDRNDSDSCWKDRGRSPSKATACSEGEC
ncbi:uncharacterized protein LOC131678341 [Topomyia yanbarensis]|uniref:uncharacterized protein LOC131678341 n=1 Tax=Topomyia yanbarensis TaxID=2498891 RepID=UPI00273BA59C|nr:uncharacterized protein LOC131678341 [Topomyia yanbarensis]